MAVALEIPEKLLRSSVLPAGRRVASFMALTLAQAPRWTHPVLPRVQRALVRRENPGTAGSVSAAPVLAARAARHCRSGGGADRRRDRPKPAHARRPRSRSGSVDAEARELEHDPLRALAAGRPACDRLLDIARLVHEPLVRERLDRKRRGRGLESGLVQAAFESLAGIVTPREQSDRAGARGSNVGALGRGYRSAPSAQSPPRAARPATVPARRHDRGQPSAATTTGGMVPVWPRRGASRRTRSCCSRSSATSGCCRR